MSFSNYVNNLFMVKCMVFMHRWCCRDHANYYMSKLQFDKYALLSRKGFCWEYALLSQNGFRCKYAPFWVCLVQTFTQTFRIWLRFCADIWTKNRRLTALIGGLSEAKTLWPLDSLPPTSFLREDDHSRSTPQTITSTGVSALCLATFPCLLNVTKKRIWKTSGLFPQSYP